MSTSENVRNYFNQNAFRWDTLRKEYFPESLREVILSKAYLRPEMVVADIGGGTGFVTLGLATRVKQVHLVEPSPAMLEMAKKNFSVFNNVIYHQTGAENLPFPDESLDAIFANMVLHHLPDPEQGIKEMVRVLRPGGRLILTDLDNHSYTWFKEEMADVWLGFDRQEIRKWFEQTGLVNVLVTDTKDTCCTQETCDCSCESSSKEVQISIFLATGTRKYISMEKVTEAYSDIAIMEHPCCAPSSETGNSSCCCPEPEAFSISADYTEEELLQVPEDLWQNSLGCGNPTAFARLQPGMTVLDIGSGRGLDVFLAAQKVGKEGRIIGIDPSQEMLKKAQQIAEKYQLANVEFRQGEAEDIPLPDETVDVILSNCVVNLSEDKSKAFREAFRVLKSGGRLNISDIVLSTSLPMEIQLDETGWVSCISGALPEQEYLDLLQQAGFSELAIEKKVPAGQIAGTEIFSLTLTATKP